MNKTLYLVRHCAASGQEPDATLTVEGREQAEALAVWLSGRRVERIVSSPYARACESLAPLAVRLGLTVETDERLVERVLCATPLPDWRERLAASFADMDLCLPGGESSRAAMARGVAAIHDAIRSPSSTTVVVTHGNLLALLLKHFDESVGFFEWQQLTNPDVYRVRYAGAAPCIERLTEAMSGDDDGVPGRPAACKCFTTPLTSLRNAQELGMDSRYAEVAVLVCRSCGQHWLRYFYENEAFTASGRWYLGAITPEQLSGLTPAEAKSILEGLPWYFYGGSLFDGRKGKESGPILLYP